MLQGYLSHLRGITPIQDSVHDSIRFTVMEREFIDSPHFQRLHFILQNSTTYAAYPSNKTSRFAHSLGVSCLAGRILTKSLVNSDPTTLRNFFEDVGNFIERHFASPARTGFHIDNYKDLVKATWEKTVRGRSDFNHSPFLKFEGKIVHEDDEFCGFPALFLADTLWTAVRVCGLVHDIGHLPMSHSFEHALSKVWIFFEMHSSQDEALKAFRDHRDAKKKEFFNDGSAESVQEYISFLAGVFDVTDQNIETFIQELPFHESRGLTIFKLIAKENRYSFGGNDHWYRTLINQLVIAILYSSVLDEVRKNAPELGIGVPTLPNFLRPLKSIIAGEIDADRLDYTIRDGRACGVQIGDYDLSRIINNSILILDEKKNDYYRIAYYERALSGIEQYFYQRYEGYKYLIFHRTSSRTEACLQELIARIFYVGYKYCSSPIADLLNAYGYVSRESGGHAKRIVDLLPKDATNIVRLDDANLRTFFFNILQIIRDDRDSLLDIPSQEVDLIESLLEIVLLREFRHIYNPFKKVSIRDRIRSILGTDFDEKAFLAVLERLTFHESFEAAELELRKAINRRFRGEVAVIAQSKKPKIYRTPKDEDAQIKIVTQNMDIVNLEVLSPSLSNMHHVETQEFGVSIYFISNDVKVKPSLIDDIEKELDKTLKNLFLFIAGARS